MCDFRAVSSDTLAVHNGTKHAYFVELLPGDIAEAYRRFVRLKTAGKKRPADELSNGAAIGREVVTKNGNEKFSCPTCHAEFEEHFMLARHMTVVSCKSPIRKSTRDQFYKTFLPCLMAPV